MAHHNTVLSQILKLVPRHEFESLARQHHEGRKLRRVSRWQQFVALLVGQLGGRQSLRDIVFSLSSQSARLYHLGCGLVARSSLARVNEKQPYTLYEALFAKLYARCQPHASRHRFRFHNKLYAMDASLIDLSLAIFPWAKFTQGKAAMKLHLGLDHDGGIPAFATVTHSHVSDLEVARQLTLPKGSIVVCDRGYFDYAWFKSLTKKNIFFVTRCKRNACYRTVKRQPAGLFPGLLSDDIVEFTGKKPREIELAPLRRIVYYDRKTKKTYAFLTNHFRLCAATICQVYKARWEIELFFKWLKQNLKIRTFLGTSRNAILTQIWIALCTALLIAYLKFTARLGWSAQQILRLIQINLFQRRGLMTLFEPPDNAPPNAVPQLTLGLS